MPKLLDSLQPDNLPHSSPCHATISTTGSAFYRSCFNFLLQALDSANLPPIHQIIEPKMDACCTQVVLEEQELQTQAGGISAKLAALHTRGVYEERIPLAMHAALTLGCVAHVSPPAQSRNLAEGFTLSEVLVSGAALVTFLVGCWNAACMRCGWQRKLRCARLCSSRGLQRIDIALLHGLDAVMLADHAACIARPALMGAEPMSCSWHQAPRCKLQHT